MLAPTDSSPTFSLKLLGVLHFAELRAKIGMVEVTMAHALEGDIVGMNPVACHIIFLLFSPFTYNNIGVVTGLFVS